MVTFPMRVLATFVITGALTIGCATKPPISSVAATNGAPPPVDVTPAPTTAAKAGGAKKASTVYPGVTPETVALYHQQGYKPRIRNGTTLFCREEGTLGTRFEHTTCASADQLADSAAAGKEAAEHLQRPSAPAGPVH